MKVEYYKWNYKEIQILFNSLKRLINIKELQFYQPYFSLYFHIHNTKKSHKIIDIQRRFFVKEVIEIINERHHTSNLQLKCQIFDNKYNNTTIQTLFCKCIPLLDPLYFMMNNYNNIIKRNPLLPSAYTYNTSSKINNMCNNAYIDTFFSYICSELTLNDTLPSFPIYYGSANGVKESFNFDITDDYSNLKEEEWFYKNLGKTYKIDMYVSDDEEYDQNSNDEISDDYISSLNNIPCQLLFIEKLDGTIEDLISSEIKELDINIIKSCIFQISFALLYLQKKFNFTHNDLHVNNVMFKKTDKIFLYYKYNNIYYKVPTHGYIFKIIDYGRAIFTFHNKIFFNDTFEKHGEAEGQYTYPNNILYLNKSDNIVNPNYSFDLCRLAITILDVCNYNKFEDYKEKQSFIDFIYNLTLNNEGISLAELNDDFKMYISIAKSANNALPEKTIQNYIFKDYRIKKKLFPKKLYYSLH